MTPSQYYNEIVALIFLEKLEQLANTAEMIELPNGAFV